MHWYFKFDSFSGIIVLYTYDFYTECGCNEIGTMSIIGSAILDCDKTTGYCNCSEGYSGSKCDKCATDYYDTTNGNSQTPTCAGTNSKLKYMQHEILHLLICFVFLISL